MEVWGGEKACAQLNRSYFFQRGREFIIEGNYRGAIESLNLLLRSQPNEYEAYFLRGVAKYNLLDLHGALSDFSAAIDENPVYTMAYQYRGITHSRLAQYELALADFQKAIEMRPGFSGAYYSRAITHFLNQQFSEAIRDYTSFISLEPTSAEAYTNRGTASLYRLDTTYAMKDYNRAVEVNPYYKDGYLRRGVLHLNLKNTDKALKDLDRALQIDSTSAIGYFYRATGNNQKGNIPEALKDFQRAIQYDPSNSIAIFNLAILRTEIGDYQNAIKNYTEVLEQNPENVLVYFNRGAVYAKIGELQNAINDLTKAIEIYPDFANAYLYRANIRAAMRDKRGYNQDTKTAEDIIRRYSKIVRTDKDAQMYSDTSVMLSKILSLDSEFNANNINRLKNSMAVNKPLPMFKLSIVTQKDTLQKFDHREYTNTQLDTILINLGIENIAITNTQQNIAGWRLMQLDTLYSQNENHHQLLGKAIVNALMRQYTTAQNLYAFLLADNPTIPALIILNKAVTNAEMIEFMSSVEGNYQTFSAQINPEERLNANSINPENNYQKEIQELQTATELMPELPYLYYNIGYLYALQGDIPKAIENYTTAIQKYPLFKEAYYNRGLLQLIIDEQEKGALDLSRAGEIGIQQAYKIIESINQTK